MCALPSRDVRRQTTTDFVEATAVSVSLLCLLHCFALPFLLLALPALAGVFFEPEGFHIAAAVLVVPAAALAFILGYRRHRVPVPALLGATGVICIAAALLAHWGDSAVTATTAAGSLLLIGGHAVNWRMRRTIAG